jgi:two-component system chemotaxis sensor kinase CheA
MASQGSGAGICGAPAPGASPASPGADLQVRELKMSDFKTGQLEDKSIMQPMLDRLAAQLVLGDGSCADPWLEGVAFLLSQIGATAKLTGRMDLCRASLALQQQVARLRSREGDRGAIEAALALGVRALQEGLDGVATALPDCSKAAAPNPSSNPLAEDRELVSDFVLESREYLSNIEVQLLALEQRPGDLEPIHSIFRGFHTLKGLAGFLEFTAMQMVAHEVETLLDLARNAHLTVTPGVIDAVLAGADYLAIEIQRVENELNGAARAVAAGNAALLETIRALMRDAADGPAPEASSAGPARDLKKLSDALRASRRGPGKSAADAVPQERRTEEKAACGGESRAVKVDTAKLDFLVDMVGEMVIAESLVRHNPEMARLGTTSLLRGLAQLGRMTNEVQKTAMSMRMVPVGQLFQKMARLVRDVSRKHGKLIELETSGEETELDRNVVEALADPLMHMVRNSIDHGIETPEGRRAAGKSATARVTLRAFHQAGHISIQVSDDGRGLNQEKIVAKAREKGLIESADHLSETEIFNLIFEPGFSTADKVTDISGRGVGMDVVRRRIQELRGRIEIQSAAGQGSTFLMKVPLTLAVIDGLVVGVGKERYVVPVFAVKELLRPTEGTISTIENREEVALVRGRLFPVMRLYRRFHVVPRSEDYTQSVLIIAECGGKDFCLMVDEVIGKQEVVIKSLGETMQEIAGVAGGAILGDGRVGLILDMEGIYGRMAHA